MFIDFFILVDPKFASFVRKFNIIENFKMKLGVRRNPKGHFVRLSCGHKSHGMCFHAGCLMKFGNCLVSSNLVLIVILKT